MKEKGAPDKAAEEMLLAFELLNKYKKDSKFIQKEVIAQQKESKLIIRDEDEAKLPGRKAAYVNTLLTQNPKTPKPQNPAIMKIIWIMVKSQIDLLYLYTFLILKN